MVLNKNPCSFYIVLMSAVLKGSPRFQALKLFSQKWVGKDYSLFVSVNATEIRNNRWNFLNKLWISQQLDVQLKILIPCVFFRNAEYFPYSIFPYPISILIDSMFINFHILNFLFPYSKWMSNSKYWYPVGFFRNVEYFPYSKCENRKASPK